MGLLSRMVAPVERASAGTPSYGMIPPLGSIQSASGAQISQATAMTVSTVYACVNRLSTDLARCSPYVMGWAKDGSKQKVKHPISKLFKRPNRQQTWFEFDRQMWVGLLLRGNAYAAIRRDYRGNPTELIPINPDAVMVLEAADGSIFYNVNRIGLWQIAMLRDFPVAIPSEDVFHLRGISFNSLVGVSTIGLARDSIGLDMALSQQANRWIANGARPSTWLKTNKVLGDAPARRLKAQFDDLHAGYQNTGKTVLLEDGIEPVALQLTSVDLQFIEQRKMQPEEVCRFYGVPPHKAGIASDTRGASQNLAAQDQDYVNSAVSERAVNFEQRFAWTFGLDEDDLFVERDLSQLLRADVLTRANVSRINILSGKKTQNEERADDGLPPKEGGDRLMMPTNMAAEGSNITGVAPDDNGRPAAGMVGTGDAGTGGTQTTSQDAATASEG
ncbi:MAG: phage portal protein [Sphingomonadales bacterium]|nr:phage portal protein [Sphingomonadales bacterium]MDE2171186.1 phage portal protein [Sphingomonadales bacterium]